MNLVVPVLVLFQATHRHLRHGKTAIVFMTHREAWEHHLLLSKIGDQRAVYCWSGHMTACIVYQIAKAQGRVDGWGNGDCARVLSFNPSVN